MTDTDLSEAISLVAFVVFTVLLAIGAVSTLVRAVRYAHAGQTWPRLLIRDLILIGGLGLDFALILGVRFSGISLRGNVPWVVVTSLLAIVSIGTYVWFELRIIERGDRRRRRARRRIRIHGLPPRHDARGDRMIDTPRDPSDSTDEGPG